MDRELASVRGTVNLTPEGALDAARGLLRDLGYAVTDRTDAAVHAERPAPGPGPVQPKPALMVTAVPQAGGGVRITVHGDDREGMQEHRARWSEWSEGLPKREAGPPSAPDDPSEAGGAVLAEAKGIDGQVALLPDRVRIGRKGLLAKGKGGDREILLEQLGSVEFSSGFTGGRIQFVPLGQAAQRGWRRSTEHEVQFNAQQSQAFEAIKRELDRRLGDERPRSEPPTAPATGGTPGGGTGPEEPLMKASGGLKDLLVFADRLELRRPLSMPSEVETVGLGRVEAATVSKGAHYTNYSSLDVRTLDGETLSIGYLTRGEAKAAKDLIERRSDEARQGRARAPEPAAPEAREPEVPWEPAMQAQAPEPTGPPPVVGGGPEGASDVPDLIRKLADLRDAGIISGEEFEAKKAQLLDRI